MAMSGAAPGIGKARSSASLLLDGRDVGALESSGPSYDPATRLSLGCVVGVATGPAARLGVPSGRVGVEVGVPECASPSSPRIDQLVGDSVRFGPGIAPRSPYALVVDGVDVGADENPLLLDPSTELLVGGFGSEFVGIDVARDEGPLEGAAVDPNRPARPPRTPPEGFLVTAPAGNGAGVSSRLGGPPSEMFVVEARVGVGVNIVNPSTPSVGLLVGLSDGEPVNIGVGLPDGLPVGLSVNDPDPTDVGPPVYSADGAGVEKNIP